MLVKLWNEINNGTELILDKYVNGENASLCGAFSAFADITFELKNRRVFGIDDATLKLHRDYEDDITFPFKIGDTGDFRLTLSNLDEGLYWYSLEVRIGDCIYYSDSTDNVNFRLMPKKGRDFRLLIYEKDFTTPEWFKGGIMYQIFVDRFSKSGLSELRPDVHNEENWSAPISQYSQKPGDDLKNDLFYGGDLRGIENKLSYLKEMGVTVLYLNPIFKAASNHKYDTGDYTEVDPAFGGNEALKSLISSAKAQGIRVILDGVFNHTGDDSVYFNKYGKYPNEGAYGHPTSKYRDWFCFKGSDDEYDCWWGIKIHPRLNHSNEECRRYFTGDEGICASYVRKGTGGWRIDVADELPDIFLDEMRKSVKAADSEAIIIGEVWENAADKIAYGHRRRYLRGKQLDSVMNYPLKNAILEFVKGKDGKFLASTLTELYSSYPKCVCDCLMNILGTHDTERILTALGDSVYAELDNSSLSTHKMSDSDRQRGVEMLKIASAIQFTVYGVPSVFYGDEAGAEGGRDPFCRITYPWENENGELLEWYRRLGSVRKNHRNTFAEGGFRVLESGEGYIIFERCGENRIITAANVSSDEIDLDITGEELLTGDAFSGKLAPMSAAVVKVD